MKRKTKPEQWVKVRVAIVSNEDSTTSKCSCGWRCSHPRDVIRENKIDRHLAKRHGGSGVRL